ncbi:MAG: hypothetical protein R3B70_19660 [Polyangiaceae bacterium]
MAAAMKLRACAVFLSAMSISALSACDQTRDHAVPEGPATGAAPLDGGALAPGADAAFPPETSVDTIREDPARYYGKTVTITGEVDKVYTDRVFELEGSGWAFNDNITVVTKTPVRIADMPLAKGDHLILKGTVQKFVTADITRDYGWTASPDVLLRIEKRPVLVAESIRLVGEYGTWSAKTTPPPTGPITTTLIIVTTIEPESVVGRRVDLGRERVQATMGNGLWVGSSAMSQVFVLPKEPVKDVKAGDWVRVSNGTVARAPKDAAKEWKLPANMEGLPWESMLYVKDAAVTKLPAP